MSKVQNLKITVNTEDLRPQLRISAPSTVDFEPVEDIETFDNGDGLDFGPNFFADSTEDDENVRFHVNLDQKAEEQLFPEEFADSLSRNSRYRNPALDLCAKDQADLNSPENLAKRLARAKRFGIEGTRDDFLVSDEKMRNLYASFGLDPEIGEKRTPNCEKYRLDTIFLRGVQEMNTKEIFSYFSDFLPEEIEWINDISCNVVWSDRHKAAKAMLSLSRPLKRVRSIREQEEGEVSSDEEDVADYVSPMKRSEEKSEKEEKVGEKSSDGEEKQGELREEKMLAEEGEGENKIDEDVLMLGVDESSVREIGKEMESLENTTNPCANPQDEEAVEVDVREHTIPPGLWRVGSGLCSKAELLLFRFATIYDVKLRGAQYDSNYYRKYGNPNIGGALGLFSESRKRKMMGTAAPIEGYFVRGGERADLRRRIDSRKILRYRRRPALSSAYGEQFPEDYPDVVTSSVAPVVYSGDDSDSADSVSTPRPRVKQPPRMKMRADEEEVRAERRRYRFVTGGREYTPPAYYSERRNFRSWDHDLYGAAEYEDWDSSVGERFEGELYTVGEEFDYSEEFLKDEDREADLPDWSELAAATKKSSKKWTPPSDLKRMKVTVENR